MKIRLFASICFAVMAIALISACGGNSTTTSTQASADVPDPCALFTGDDAAAVLGEPVQAPNRSEQDNTKSCTYMTKGASPRVVSVVIVKPCSMADYSNYAEGPMATPIEGIGMHASWDKSTLLVHSNSGDTCIYANGGGNPPGTDPADDKPALEQAKIVATKVLQNLEPGSGGGMGGM